jgi:hypothetical protein
MNKVSRQALEFLGYDIGPPCPMPRKATVRENPLSEASRRCLNAPTMTTIGTTAPMQRLSPGGFSLGDPGGSRLHIREPALVWPMTRWSSNSAKDGRSSMRTTREGACRVAASTARAARFSWR